MALTKVTGFDGEAEVQGALRQVRYNDSVLSISGLSLEDAYAVLDGLSAKSIQAVRVGPTPVFAQPVPTPRAVVEAMVSSAAPPAQAEREASPALALVPSPEVKAGPPPVAATETPTAVAPGDVPEKVAKTGRFIEVLDWVMKSKGLVPKQVDEIVAEVEKLKALPVVARVRDLKDKVVSNLAAYAEAGEA